MLEKFHRKYIGDRNFYKRYIALALPMIIQNAVTNLVSFLDNIMVGQLGTEQMSGVAIVNCTSQQKVDTFFIFYTLKTEHSTPYIVLVSNSLMSMQVFLH